MEEELRKPVVEPEEQIPVQELLENHQILDQGVEERILALVVVEEGRIPGQELEAAAVVQSHHQVEEQIFQLLEVLEIVVGWEKTS